MALPSEVETIIEGLNENANTILVNRERLRALFDDSLGLSAKSLIAGNDWTLLRDLWVQEIFAAIGGFEVAMNQLQNLQ